MTDWTESAAWYDVLNPWGPSDDFYLGLVMAADRVLDVGCGTGVLLHSARGAGHTGRLCGIDPDPAMLNQARTRADIEWADCDAAGMTFDREFDLAVMASHAFQVFISDADVRSALTAIRAALAAGGRFAFETRHPQARAWEGWHNASFVQANPDGQEVTVSYHVDDVTGDVVRLSETLSGSWWDDPQPEWTELRFLAPVPLAEFLHETGFRIETQYGDWNSGPLTPASEEIITVARRTP